MSTGMGFNDVGTSGFPVDISGGFDSGAFSEWGPITIVLGMLTFSIVTVLYMFAISFNLKSLKMWAKSEFMQIIITFLLVIFMFAVIDIVWDVMVDIVTNLYTTDSMLYKPQGGWPVGIRLDPFSFSQMFIKNTMIDCEINVYRVLYAVNFFYDFFGKMSTEILGSDPVGGWYTTVYSSIFKYINGHINMLLLFHWIQIRFLSLIKFTMPIVILLGLMLRIFPMSRGSGGLLIAVGFGFFAVYPISIALLMTMQPPATSFCTEFGPPALLDISNQNTVVMSAADVAHTRNAIEAEESEVKILIDKLKNFIPLFYLQALFLPIVSLIITFTFIRQTGALFGADLAEVGRGMIKLI